MKKKDTNKRLGKHKLYGRVKEQNDIALKKKETNKRLGKHKLYGRVKRKK